MKKDNFPTAPYAGKNGVAIRHFSLPCWDIFQSMPIERWQQGDPPEYFHIPFKLILRSFDDGTKQDFPMLAYLEKYRIAREHSQAQYALSLTQGVDQPEIVSPSATSEATAPSETPLTGDSDEIPF